jgi:hypothetical protein
MHTHHSHWPSFTQRTLYCKVYAGDSMRTGGAKRMNADLVWVQQAQVRLRGEAR